MGWELIFVDDDSPDGTAEQVREVAARDRRVRVLQRVGRRGLSSACVEGMLATPAPYVAVMDGDLQHDETLLPRMLAALKDRIWRSSWAAVMCLAAVWGTGARHATP